MIEIILFFISAGFIYFLLNGKVKEKTSLIQKEFYKKDEIVVRQKPEEGSSLDNILEKGDRLFNAGALKNAEKIYIEAVKINPKDPRAYKSLSKIYIKEGEDDFAIASLEKACELDGKDEGSFNNLGFMYFKKKEYYKAANAYKKSIVKTNVKPHRLVNLSMALIEIGELEEAVQYLEKAVKIEPKPETLKIMIDIYKKTGETEQSKKSYKKLLELEPTNIEAKRELAKEK